MKEFNFKLLIIPVILSLTLLSCKKEKNALPVFESITTDPVTYPGSILFENSLEQGQELTLTCNAYDSDNDPLSYSWSSESGSFPQGETGKTVTWRAPVFDVQTSDMSMQGALVEVYISDGQGQAYGSYSILVRRCCYSEAVPVINQTPYTSEITENSVNISCTIDSDHNNEIYTRGVCYNTLGDPDIYDEIKTSGSGTGDFSVTLTGLSSNTTYYAKAFATNSSGTTYSNEISFTTDEECDTRIVEVSGTGIVQVDCGETWEADATIMSYSSDKDVTRCGLCWSKTNTSPTISDDYSEFEGTIGSFGKFTGVLENLEPNTTYYFRAFAENSCGISYGVLIRYFTTPDFDPDDCEGGGDEKLGYSDLTFDGVKYRLDETSPGSEIVLYVNTSGTANTFKYTWLPISSDIYVQIFNLPAYSTLQTYDVEYGTSNDTWLKPNEKFTIEISKSVTEYYYSKSGTFTWLDPNTFSLDIKLYESDTKITKSLKGTVHFVKINQDTF